MLNDQIWRHNSFKASEIIIMISILIYFDLNYCVALCDIVLCRTVLSNGASSGLILGLRPANERRRYKVTPSLIGWAQT